MSPAANGCTAWAPCSVVAWALLAGDTKRLRDVSLAASGLSDCS